MTREFVAASELRTDGAGGVRRQDYWETIAEDAPEADECAVCGADGPDCRRVRLPDRDREKVALCATCRRLWGVLLVSDLVLVQLLPIYEPGEGGE